MRLYRRGGARRTRRLVEGGEEQRPCPRMRLGACKAGWDRLGLRAKPARGRAQKRPEAQARPRAPKAGAPATRLPEMGGRCGLPRWAPNGRDLPSGSPNEAGLAFECYLIVSGALLIKGCTKSESTTRAGQSPAPCGHQGELFCAAPDNDGAASSARGRAHPHAVPSNRRA
jgi:hypothetical protein